MKKLLTCVILTLLVCVTHAQSYESLWRQVDDAEKKDLPATQIKVLNTIADKAEKNKDYGQLLAARLMAGGLQTSISPDSAEVELAHLETQAERAERSDATLAAVYNAVLGYIYKSHTDNGFNRFGRNDSNDSDTAKAKAEKYCKKAMANPTLLASVKADTYTPLVRKGTDSSIFGNDILHVVGFAVKDYDTMYDYYSKAGNRAAACIVSSHQTHDISELDSLINVYGDLPEAGALAINRFNLMENGYTAEQKVAYIDYALGKWGSWKPIAELKNNRKNLTNPQFLASFKHQVNIPDRENKIYLNGIRNVKEITIKVSLLNANGNSLAVINQDYSKLSRMIKTRDVFVQSRTFSGKKEFEIYKDSMTMASLPIGVYLVEGYADGIKIKDATGLYFVTDLYMMSESLPGEKKRCVIVNATTGQPVSGAAIKDISRNGDGKEYTANKNGEVTIDVSKNRYNQNWYIYTTTDKACPVYSMWRNYSYNSYKPTNNIVNIYTDRSLYRPGQNLHAAIVVYKQHGNDSTTVVANEKVTITLRDANYETVETKEVNTDAYGTSSVDFTIPQNGLTGMFTIQATCGQSSSTSIRVEEYKRPTFYIEYPEFKNKYAAGDTITIKGYAKTYAGMPVQDAKVEYAVDRRRAMWCWWYGGRNFSNQLYNGTAMTDKDGAFEIKMPMTMPKDDEYDGGIVPLRGMFFNFTAEAKVTDAAGETHSGTFSLPLGTKETSLSCDLPDKILNDSLTSITFNYTNAAGKPTDGSVSFTLGDKKYKNVEANKPFALNSMKSGKYHLFAVCGNDTIEQDVVIFSIKDKRPITKTDDWFYASSEEFSKDKPVYIQVGSSAKDCHILYNVFSADKILESGFIDQSDAINTRAFEYKEEYGDGITVTYAWVKDGTMYSHTASIRKPLPDKRLLVEWNTFRDRLTPGQQEEWTLQVKHPNGKPADALFMVTMYDKSLDQIYNHNWNASLNIYRNIPYAVWKGMDKSSLSLNYFANINYLTVHNLALDQFNEKYLSFLAYYSFNTIRPMRYGSKVRGIPTSKSVMANVDFVVEEAAPAPMAANGMMKKEAKYESVKEDSAYGGSTEEGNETSTGEISIRENLNESAFFYPNLTTDSEGNISVKFTLPESVTTWKVMGYAHDKDMNYGIINGEAVAKKTVMVQPNMPRFVRVTDKANISARLFNSSENTVTGKAKIELINPETDKTVYSYTENYSIEANGTSATFFSLDMPKIMESIEKSGNDQTATALNTALLVCRITVVGTGYSDGEQHYLPVLPDMEMVTNTVPFTQHGPGTKNIDVERMLPATQKNGKVTVEYTNNPAWLMIQALPYIGDVNEENAISLVSAFYANSLANNMLNSSPKIKQTFEMWSREKGEETSLMSELQKNQSLKDLTLNETPWVADARNETEQRQNLGQFFNENNIKNRLSSTINGLKKLQNGDGSWSWWKGMQGSPWMTASVCGTLVRLNTLIGNQSETGNMLKRGMEYLAKEIKKEVIEMKKDEKKGHKNLMPSELAMNYLYMRALDNRKLNNDDTRDIAYLVEKLAAGTSKLSIYGKANSAVILAKNGYTTKAKTFLQSMKEYSVYKEEMGRYYDTPKALYSWCDYRIPTQSAAIEALSILNPQDTKTIEEMQRWLLQEKRTQAWDTPINSVNAVYAFFCGQTGNKIFTDKLATQEQTVLKLNGTAMDMPKATAGIGYVKTSVPATGAKTVTAEKTSKGTSWGAVYTQFLQPMTEVENSTSGIKIERKMYIVTGNSTEAGRVKAIGKNATMKIGDKIKVVITITADRDYDFVQVLDKRAACLEPVNQLSGYRYGYYCAPKDYTTNFYFDRMAKGKHVIETEYYVERAGEYNTGTCTAQCAYSPEYSGRTRAEKIRVTNE